MRIYAQMHSVCTCVYLLEADMGLWRARIIEQVQLARWGSGIMNLCKPARWRKTTLLVDKYMRNLYIFEAEAAEKDIRPGQEALLKWEGTRDYFLFASVYIQSAGFLIDMFLGDDIERVVA